MTYICAECGKEHGDLPRYFMRRMPENAAGKTLDATLEGKSLCRTIDGRCFVQCELEVPLRQADGKPLGFIVWVEIQRAVYAKLKSFWAGDGEVIDDLLEGQLANPVTCVEGSYGTRIRFKALEEDPTPYIKWVAPGPLQQVVDEGASAGFWHSVVDTTLER